MPASAPPSLLEELRWLRVRHHHVDGWIGTGASEADRRGLVYHVSCLSSLEEGAKVELLVWGKDGGTLGTWQSRGGKLIRVG